MCDSKQDEGRKWYSPTNDLVFKAVFGDKEYTDITERYLKSILDLPDSEFESISFTNPYVAGENIESKDVILDIKLSTRSGRIIHIEMQMASEPSFRERMLFYSSRLISRQLKEGKEYTDINPVISIVVSNFKLITENDEYHNCFELFDKNTGARLTDYLQIHSLDLTKLNGVYCKRNDSELIAWLRFIQAGEEAEMMEIVKSNPDIPEMKKASDVVKRVNVVWDEQFAADYRDKVRRDELSLRNYALNAEKIGIEKGIEIGKLEGRAELIDKMKDKGYTDDEIAEIIQ